MGVTFFDLKPKKKKENKIKKEKFILTKNELAYKPSYFSYNENGEEKILTTDYYVDNNGSYVFNKLSIEEYPIYEKNEISYVTINEHFSYMDKDGIERVFNKLDTLQFDENTNTYTGLVGEIDYISTQVEVFPL